MSRMMKSLLSFAALGALMGNVGFPSQEKTTNVQDALESGGGIRLKKLPKEPEQKLQTYKFTAGGKIFECLAGNKGLAMAKFNAWKRLNKIK